MYHQAAGTGMNGKTLLKSYIGVMITISLLLMPILGAIVKLTLRYIVGERTIMENMALVIQ